MMEVRTGGWARSELGGMPRLTRRGARGGQVALERERWMRAAGQVVEPVQRRSGGVVVREGVRLRLVLWRHSIGAYFKSARLPDVPVEAVCSGSAGHHRAATRSARAFNRSALTYRPRGVFPAAHEDRPIPPTPIIWSQAYVRPQHRSRLAKQILEILPPDTVGELQGISGCNTPPTRLGLTFPTKRLTRPSAPTAEGRRLVIKGVMDRLTARRVRVSRGRKIGPLRSGHMVGDDGQGCGIHRGCESRMVGGGELRIDSQSEKSGWGGAGGALAMAAAMTASISAEVGGLEGEYDLLNDAASSCREMSQAQRSLRSIAARFSHP